MTNDANNIKFISKKICTIALLQQVIMIVFAMFGGVILSPVYVTFPKLQDAFMILINIIALAASVYVLTKEYSTSLGVDIKPLFNKSFEYKFVAKLSITLLGLDMALVYLISPIMEKLETYGIIFGPGSGLEYKTEPAYLLFSLIYFLIMAPLFEEVFVRGLLFNVLKSQGVLFAIIGTSILFSAAHGPLPQNISSFMAGVILAYAIYKTGSIVPGIICHFINNLFAQVASFILHSSIDDSILDFVGILLIICATFIMIKNIKNIKIFVKENKGPSIKQLFTSWQGILIIVLLIFRMLPEF